MHHAVGAGGTASQAADAYFGCVCRCALAVDRVGELVEPFVAPGQAGCETDRSGAPALVQFTGEQHFGEVLIEIAVACLVGPYVLVSFFRDIGQAEYVHRYTITDRVVVKDRRTGWHQAIRKFMDPGGRYGTAYHRGRQLRVRGVVTLDVAYDLACSRVAHRIDRHGKAVGAQCGVG